METHTHEPEAPCSLDGWTLRYFSCEDGAVFIDRDPILFGALLRYLRTGHLCVPPNLTVDVMLAEADYFLVSISRWRSRASSESTYKLPRPLYGQVFSISCTIIVWTVLTIAAWLN